MSGGFCGHCMDEPCSCDTGMKVQRSIVDDVVDLTLQVERLTEENRKLRQECQEWNDQCHDLSVQISEKDLRIKFLTGKLLGQIKKAPEVGPPGRVGGADSR